MSSRLDTKVEAKGIFPGAEVVRGPHWRFKDQDGEEVLDGELSSLF